MLFAQQCSISVIKIKRWKSAMLPLFALVIREAGRQTGRRQ